MASEPPRVLWSVTVTKSIPRARWAWYSSTGSVNDSALRRARMPALPDVSEYLEWTWRSALKRVVTYSLYLKGARLRRRARAHGRRRARVRALRLCL